MDNNSLPATILVIFGITGDLSHRYLLPALAEVAKAQKLPKQFRILGVSRRQVNKSEIFNGPQQFLEQHSQMLQMDMDNSASYQTLKAKLQEISGQLGSTPEIIYYLSIPPQGVTTIIERLGEAGLNSANSKLLLEKPFGVDLESARGLIAQTTKYFPEDQIFRVDHYLAKEMAQNIVVFLGSNALIRNVWSNQFIEKIQIEASEKIGIENRVHFYESTGALRDLVQSHLLQLAALTLMEPCSNIFDFEELPRRRQAALQNLKVDLSGVVRGQYSGYRDEVKNQSSQRETFVSLKLASSDPRWSGVPITLTTGKNLNERLTQIKVYFKKADNSEGNLLILELQPSEGILLNLWVKQPGYERKLQKLPLEFKYDQHFGRLPEAYEQVLVDVMQSNHSLFASGAEVLASWQILQPVLEKWAPGSNDLVIYQPGSAVDDVLNLVKS